MSELLTLLHRHCTSDSTPTAFPGLTLSRSETFTGMYAVTAPPLFCVVAEGRKQIVLGDEEFFYDPSTYLITTADLPIQGQVVEAPYYGLNLLLDQDLVAQLVVDIGPEPADRLATRAMAVNALEGGLLDAVLRLLRLLDEPEHLRTLGPMIQREIYYRLLRGPHGEMLRQLAMPTSQLSHISRTINFIRRHFDQRIRVEELAELARMSAPSFHRHFRAVTGMSPLQFQKRIRLEEARRRLLAANEGAAKVALDVGYESPSQFSREYSRLFGAPPQRDAALARHALASVVARAVPALHG